MKEELAGTLVRCPACSLEFTAQPDDMAETGIRPGETPPRPASPAGDEHVRETEPAAPGRLPRFDDYEDDDDFDVPRRRRRGPDIPRALDRVNGPAIGLMVVGFSGVALALLGLAANMFGAAANGRNPAAWADAVGGVVTLPISLATCILIIIGAFKMKSLDNIGLAKAAAIIAMIPCTSPCCILGLPFGIWALNVLSDSNVADAFAMKRRRYASDDFDRDRDRD
jgi:hypothetical protein